jgi:rsbT co-antagonist protein RsbR
MADGHDRWLETHKVPLHDASGKVLGVVVWFDDITERVLKQQEEARQMDVKIRNQAEALQELAAPLLPVAEGVLVMPLIGRIDGARAQMVMQTLLDGVVRHQARTAILDVTGVRQVDTGVVRAIVEAARAVRLLGTEAIVTGIRPEVAQTPVELGVELRDLVALSDLKSGIAHALGRQGAR